MDAFGALLAARDELLKLAAAAVAKGDQHRAVEAKGKVLTASQTEQREKDLVAETQLRAQVAAVTKVVRHVTLERVWLERQQAFKTAIKTLAEAHVRVATQVFCCCYCFSLF